MSELRVNILNANTTNAVNIVGGNASINAVSYNFGLIANSVGYDHEARRTVHSELGSSRSMAYGNNKLVMAWDDNASRMYLEVSTDDGVTWTGATSQGNVTTRSTQVAYGNGTFIVVGASIQTSADGLTWTNRTMANTNRITDIEYGNGVFVAVGDGGAIQRSTNNGVNWTNVTSPNTNGSWQTVSYGNGVFVAAGGVSGLTQFATSPDGLTWTNRSGPAGAPPMTLAGSAYGNGVFIVGNYNYNYYTPNWVNYIIYSTDNGVSWKMSDLVEPYSMGLTALIYDSYNGLFWAAGGNWNSDFYPNNSTYGGKLRYSPNGKNWYKAPLPLNMGGYSSYIEGIVFANNRIHYATWHHLGTILANTVTTNTSVAITPNSIRVADINNNPGNKSTPLPNDYRNIQVLAGNSQVDTVWFNGVSGGDPYNIYFLPLQGAENCNVQTFSANGTWTKPSWAAAQNAANTSADLVIVHIWGAGGGGAANNTVASGGGGGAFVYGIYMTTQLGATATVVVGIGGSASQGTTSAVQGANGGLSSFNTNLIAYGGGGGGAVTNPIMGGGGWFSGPTTTAGGGPLGGAVGGTGGDSTFGGGGGYNNTPYIGGNSIYGGGGGSGIGAGGKSIYGGGGGAGENFAGGSSVYGGFGGNNSVNATVPGGGGGGGRSNQPIYANAGANGKVIVYTIRKIA